MQELLINGVIVFVILFAGGFVQGMTGFGSALVGMGLLVLFLPYKLVFPTMMLSSFSMTTYVIIKKYKYIDTKLFLFPLIFAILGRFIGLQLYILFNGEILKVILGFIIFFTGIFLLTKPNFRINPTKLNGGIFGLLGGTMGGIANTDGPMLVLYFISATDNKNKYMANIQLIFFVSTIVSTILHLCYGTFTTENISLVPFGAIGIVLGGRLGVKLFDKLDSKKSRNVVLCMLIIVSVYMIVSYFSF